MGQRKFMEQIVIEENMYESNKIIDPVEVTTTHEYVQYVKSLDQRSCQLGGRCNGWRVISMGIQLLVLNKIKGDFPSQLAVYDSKIIKRALLKRTIDMIFQKRELIKTKAYFPNHLIKRIF
jgi:hypothetical protein